MNDEIKELKTEIRNLNKKIAGLERDVDSLIEKDSKTPTNSIRELQEEVAKLAGQPVGMLFTYLA